jgi:hypothetical protein
MNDETIVLLRVLDSQRNHIFHALEGLADADLRRPVLPSTWTCLGLVRHLTLADERYWFRCVVGGESTSYFPTDPGGDWAVGADESAAAVLDAYRAEIALANEHIRSTPIDASPRWRDPRWKEWGNDFPSLRVILLHMIVETATHAGHLDAVRELIDGRQWVVV